MYSTRARVKGTAIEREAEKRKKYRKRKSEREWECVDVVNVRLHVYLACEGFRDVFVVCFNTAIRDGSIWHAKKKQETRTRKYDTHQHPYQHYGMKNVCVEARVKLRAKKSDGNTERKRTNERDRGRKKIRMNERTRVCT